MGEAGEAAAVPAAVRVPGERGVPGAEVRGGSSAGGLGARIGGEERERRRTKKSLVKEKNEELSNLCDTPKRITSPSSSNSLALSPFLSLCDANERETLLRPERIVEGKTRKNRRKDKKQDTKKRLKRN